MSTSSADEVVLSVSAGVAHILLNRPAKLNSVTPTMARLLTKYFSEIEDNPDIRAAVISGAGDRAFCTGADLKTVMDGAGDQFATTLGGPFGMLRFPRTKPLIGVVHGYAIAGGFEIALSCDILVAEHGVVFSLPELTRGLLPNGGGLYRLAKVLPRNIANEVILAGRTIDGDEALASGLINHLVAAGAGLDVATGIAQGIAACPPGAVDASMRILRAIYEGGTDPLWDLGAVIAGVLRKSDETRTLARNFVERS